MGKTIPALTITQPFASLIASGEKWVENRCWPTGYRGPIAIHAGKGKQYLDADELRNYVIGAVVATARLVACVHLESVEKRDPLACDQLATAGIDRAAFLAHDHTEGPWCWVLSDIRRLDPPVPATGKQGLWGWTAPSDSACETRASGPEGG